MGEEVENGNGIVRREKSRKSKKLKWLAILSILAICGAVAGAALYQSQKISGTITPTGGLTLTGSFGTGYVIGSPKVTTWTIVNNAGGSVNYYIEVNVTKSGGGAASDLDLNFGTSTIVPVCAGSPTVCTYTSPTAALASGATTTKDTSITFRVGAIFTVTEQALGN